MRRWSLERSGYRVVAVVSIVTCCVVAPARENFGDELFKLTAFDATSGDSFRSAVAINGNTAIIGAQYHDADGTDAGAAYVFDVTTGVQRFKLTPSDSTADDLFGISVSISGNTAIVGAVHNSSGGYRAGAAYLFDVTTGQELFKLTASDPAAYDWFGYSVAISGNRAVIGAQGTDSVGVISGAAYVFDVTTGQELFKLEASEAGDEDRFGWSVDISGNIAIVGAILDSSADFRAGAAYLFDVTTGQELRKLTSHDIGARDRLGYSVAIDGNTAIVGSDNTLDLNAGSAYVFDVTTGEVIRKLTAIDGAPGESFGTAVDISGNVAVVGAAENIVADIRSGSVYLFDITTGTQLLELTASDATERGYFGSSVAINNDTVLIGSGSPFRESTLAGSSYLFDVSSGPPGDFNTDGTVDAADYAVWRNGLGTTYTQTDYDMWRTNFGRSAAGAASVPGLTGGSTPAVPEPAVTGSLAIAAVGLLVVPRRRSPIGQRYRISRPTD
jgi:WD40 repeat protein